MEKQMNLRFVWLLLAACVTSFIWQQSTLPREESTETSEAVREVIVTIVGGEETALGSFFDRFVRKIAHVTEFAVLGLCIEAYLTRRHALVRDLIALAFGLVVSDVLHNAAVVQQRLSRHSLLAAGNHRVHLLEVLHHQSALTLCRGELGEQSLAEALLLQVVRGHGTLGCDVGRSVALHVVALTQNGHAALARCHEGRQSLVAVSVLHEDVLGREQIGAVVGREVAIAEEGVQGVDLLNGREHSVGGKNIKCHFCLLLL